jgi:hypothetical protein
VVEIVSAAALRGTNPDLPASLHGRAFLKKQLKKREFVAVVFFKAIFLDPGASDLTNSRHGPNNPRFP